MKRLSEEELRFDLQAWLWAEAAVIEMARGLRGGGGWEQWAVVQFLRWQDAKYQGDGGVNYQREWPLQEGPKSRRFDIAYNCVAGQPAPDAEHPLIFSQWKTGYNDNTVSAEVTKDIQTLVEPLRAAHVPAPWLPLIVVFGPPGVTFAGSWTPENAPPATQVRITLSTADTWKAFGLL